MKSKFIERLNRTKNKSLEIYIKSSAEKHETVFSGVTFIDFIESNPIPIENILLLKGHYWGEKSWNKFELLEGRDQIARLKREDIYNYGDFCFVDYVDAPSIDQLSEEHIAELLYLAHMFKPLRSPFFKVLQNKFAYLAHDDGWYSKLYCRDSEVSISILLNKLRKLAETALGDGAPLLPDHLVREIYKLAEAGLFIEVDVSASKSRDIIIRLYEVGEYENMDDLLFVTSDNRPPASLEMRLADK